MENSGIRYTDPIDEAPKVEAEAITFSDPMDKIAHAVVHAQKAMGEIRKNCVATGEKFTWRYADLAAVVDAVTPALLEQGVGVIQGPTAEYLDDNSARVRVTTMLLHETGQWAKNILTLRPLRTDPQGVGSAITYGRRYALQSLCNVATERDDDGGAASGRGQLDVLPDQQPPGQQGRGAARARSRVAAAAPPNPKKLVKDIYDKLGLDRADKDPGVHERAILTVADAIGLEPAPLKWSGFTVEQMQQYLALPPKEAPTT